MEKYKGVLNTNFGDLATVILNPRNAFEKHIPELFIKANLASLFDQFLLFDKVSIELNPLNFATVGIIIENFGLENIESCIVKGEIEFSLLGSVFTGLGEHGKGKIDERLLYGQPPVVAGYVEPKQVYKLLEDSWSRPEKN
jgi:hypothetical protein